MSTTQTNSDRVIARLYAKGEFRLESAAHFGGGEPGMVDMTLVRGPDGRPCIQGSSIAGAARTWLARRLHPWEEFIRGDKYWNRVILFGYNSEDEQLTMSSLRVSDAAVVDDTFEVALRDGVRLDNKSGIAVEGAKYDFEVVEPGSRFLLQLCCVIRGNEQQLQQELEDQFHALLHGFRLGEVPLGARTSRGLGRGRVEFWEYSRLEMHEKEDILAWLNREPFKKGTTTLPEDTLPDNRSFLQIRADFSLNHSLLVRQVHVDQGKADLRQFCAAGRPLLPGTSLAGSLRARVEFIARLIWDNKDTVGKTLAEMFGPLHDKGQENALWRSRIGVEESFVQNTEFRRQDRVAIDRFTGGALEHAKFDEEPVVVLDGEKENLSMVITLENPRNYEIGLLLLTLKDFWLGRVGLGGEASLGRGLLSGHQAELNLKNKKNIQTWILKPDDSAVFSCENGDQDILNKYVEAAQREPEAFDFRSRNPQAPFKADDKAEGQNARA